MIRGKDLTFRHTYICMARATGKTDLVVCSSYEDETSADGQQHLAYKTYLS